MPTSVHASRRFLEVQEDTDNDCFEVVTHSKGPIGSLPLTDEMLRHWPSGDLFGLSQNAGMGWNPEHVDRDPLPRS